MAEIVEPLRVSFTDEAADVIGQMAAERGVSEAYVVSRGIALYKFVSEQLADGGEFLIAEPKERWHAGRDISRVHFIL